MRKIFFLLFLFSLCVKGFAQSPVPPLSVNLLKKVVTSDSSSLLISSGNSLSLLDTISSNGTFHFTGIIRLADTLNVSSVNARLGSQSDLSDLALVTYTYNSPTGSLRTGGSFQNRGSIYIDFGNLTNPPHPIYLTVRVVNQAGLGSTPKVFILNR